MPTDSPPLAVRALAVLAVYLLHSTLLIGGVWVLLRLCPVRNFAVRERLWKLAALLPLVTAPLQQTDWLPRPRALFWNLTTRAAGNAIPERPTILAPQEHPPPPRGESAHARTGRTMHAPAAGESVPESTPSRPAVPPAVRDAPWTIDVPPQPADDAAQDSPPSLAPRVSYSSPPSSALPPIMAHDLAALPAIVGSHPIAPSDSHDWWPDLPTGVVFAALGLAAFGLLRLIATAIAVHRRLRCAEPITSGPLRDSLERVLRRRQFRRAVTLLCSADVSEPAALGVWRWTIVVSDGLEEHLQRDELEALFAHELAHFVRRDTSWLWIGRVLCAFAPWQPLNRLAVQGWRDAAEHLCDTWAVEQGASPLALARCLARAAEWRLTGAPSFGLTAAGAQSTLTARIEWLAAGAPRPGARSPGRAVLTVLTLSAAALLACCGPRLGASASGHAAPSSPVESAATARTGPPVILASPANQSYMPAERTVVDDVPALAADFQALLADLYRLDELLARENSDPEFQAARDGFRSRIDHLQQRCTAAASLSRPASKQSDTPHPAESGAFQETMP